jgi:hypothetical protein
MDGKLSGTVFCWVSVPLLTMVVSSVAFFELLFTNNSQAGWVHPQLSNNRTSRMVHWRVLVHCGHLLSPVSLA